MIINTQWRKIVIERGGADTERGGTGVDIASIQLWLNCPLHSPPTTIFMLELHEF
jgi:hypothetical protein